MSGLWLQVPYVKNLTYEQYNAALLARDAEIERLRAALEEARTLASRRGPTDAIGALNRIEAIAVAALRHQQSTQTEPK